MKKVVIVKDFAMGDDRIAKFDFLKEYGVEIKVVTDRPGIDEDGFSKMFLQMEKQGPDSLDINEDLVREAEDADIIISHISAVNSKAIENAKNLEAVCILRSGVENINVPNATAHGVKVVNAPGRLAIPVSEYTIGMIISEMKNIARSYADIRNGGFTHSFPNAEYSANISGLTVGIIGLGAIGKRVARVLEVMGANIVVYDPYMPAERVRDMGYDPVDLNELCRRSDVISVHFRLTAESEGLIGEEQFACMKPTAFLINTARAGLIDETALITALTEHRIGGAALDVFHQEPLPENHPFLTLDNVTLTAHMAGTCSDVFGITFNIMKEALVHYFETGEWINVVNG